MSDNICNLKSNQHDDKPPSKFGLYTAFGIAALAIGGSIAAIPFLTPAMRRHALPYIPATDKQLKNVFKAIKTYREANSLGHLKPTKTNAIKLIDLGSGDGRIVFEATKRGYQSTGVELNAILVIYSKLKTLFDWSNKTSRQDIIVTSPRFIRADFWKVSMKEYDFIVIFGVQEMMKDLASKLKEEMKPGALIVSCRNPVPNYKSVHYLEDELDSVWIYNKDSLYIKVETSEKNNYKVKQDDDDDDD
jgi:hypothetical protein